MNIKTIREQRADLFDANVNFALENGWRLARRDIVPCPANPYNTLFFAELVKLDPVEEPAPMSYTEALRVIRDTCRDAADCSKDGCPIWAWCDKYIPNDIPASPNDWDIPEG